MPDLSIYSHLLKIPSLIETTFILKLIIAFFLGALIGWERERTGKTAGIRTFGLICAGSCAFSILSLALQDSDPARIISYIAMGIGFIGGGILYLAGDGEKSMHGITTAASLWVTASLGILVAFELYIIAVAASLLTFITLLLPSFPFWTRFSKKKKRNLI